MLLKIQGAISRIVMQVTDLKTTDYKPTEVLGLKLVLFARKH